MTKFRNAAPALIAESDVKFLDTITSDPQSKVLPPVIAKTGKEAQLLLADSNRHFGGVFVSPTVLNPHAISVIRFSHLHRPATPVFLIHEGQCPFSPDDMKQLGIEKALPKPLKYSDLMALISPAVAVFDSSSALEASKLHNDALNTEITSEDDEFKPIRAQNFLSGTTSFFDIYVRLGSGRYLKLIQAGDAFSIDRVINYLQKGVTHFYLRRETQEHYMAYCDKLATVILKSDKVSIQVKASQVLNQGDETFKFLQDRGVSEQNLQYAANFMKNVTELVSQLQPGKQPILKGFLADVSSYEHGVATSIIASMLMNSLHMTSSDPVETVGVASLLHDIGLYHLNLTQFDEDETLMTEDQKKMYYTHPLVGADILKKIPRLKPVVIQAVAQHHERRNKKGFPSRIGPGSISVVADIVGISDEFQNIIAKVKRNPKVNLADEMEKRIFNNFSNNLINEFKKVFCASDEKAPTKVPTLTPKKEDAA